MKYNIEEDTKEKVLENDWDIIAFYFTQNGKYQIMSSSEDAKSKMYITEVATGKELNFPEIDGQAIESASFSKDETMALLTVGNSQLPTNTYSYNTASGKYHKLTDFLNKEKKPGIWWKQQLLDTNLLRN